MGGDSGKKFKCIRVILQKGRTVVNFAKYVKLPLGIHVKVFLSIGFT
jgi:hypothetical protein